MGESDGSTRRRRKRPPLGPIGQWSPADYLISALGGVTTESGRVAAGVAIRFLWAGSPKGRRPPAWNVTHLGSGHRICVIEAVEARAFVLADELIALGNWGFDGLDGWKNQSPDLLDRFRDWVTRHPKEIRFGGSNQSHEVAQMIAEARA